MGILEGHHKFAAWRLYPGMLFGDRGKWWGDMGDRPRSHEGVDFCCFLDTRGRERGLDQSHLLHTVHGGRVIHTGDDFLGRSVFVDSGTSDASARTLVFIYAHIHPVPGIAPGKRLRKEEAIGTVKPAREKQSVKPHLHISTVWIPQQLDKAKLDWKTLVTLKEVEFCDPLPFLGEAYEITALPQGE